MAVSLAWRRLLTTIRLPNPGVFLLNQLCPTVVADQPDLRENERAFYHSIHYNPPLFTSLSSRFAVPLTGMTTAKEVSCSPTAETFERLLKS